MKRRDKEAWFTSQLIRWCRHNWPYNGPIEVKYSYDKLFNYKSGIKSHQLPCLLSTINNNFVYKLSDASAMIGYGQLPFDIICYHNAFPMIAIMWDRPHNKTFYMIKPTIIQKEIDIGSKSLSEQRAEEICFLKSELK